MQTSPVSRYGVAHNCTADACVAVEQRDIFSIVDLDPEYFDSLVNVNVLGTFHCLKEEMNVIKDGGSILDGGSIASQYASQGVPAYVAAKHALIGLTKVAAFEGG